VWRIFLLAEMQSVFIYFYSHKNFLPMKNFSILFLLSPFIFFSCSEDEDDVRDAEACFSVNATQTTDSTFTFLFDQCPPVFDLSYWDFDDGQYSSNPNPSHVFNHYGTYDVKLTVTNETGETHSMTKTIVVGHYSLDKIVFTEATTNIAYPKWLHFSPLGVIDSVNNPTLLPWTHDFPDDPSYDLLDSAHYVYSEQSTSNLSSQGFTVFPSMVSNNKYDAVVNLLGDTARITLHYKFVPR
jgi:PKD repeat protein